MGLRRVSVSFEMASVLSTVGSEGKEGKKKKRKLKSGQNCMEKSIVFPHFSNISVRS